jgi:hypothetical protein
MTQQTLEISSVAKPAEPAQVVSLDHFAAKPTTTIAAAAAAATTNLCSTILNWGRDQMWVLRKGVGK